MRNIIILCAILLIAIATLAGIYFTDLAGKDSNNTRVLNYIPADAAFVLNFKNNESFYEIFKDYELFDAIIGEKRAAEIKELKQTLLNQPALSEITSDKNIFISFHPTKDSVNFLYGISLDNSRSANDMKELISEKANLSATPALKDIYQLKFTGGKRPLYIFLQKGVAIASFSSALLSKCTSEKEAHLKPSFIDEINKNTSKNINSPVNLFVNHSALSGFFQHFMNGKPNGNSALLKNLNGISALSMNFKSDALMFNGISEVDASGPNFLNIFLGQKAASNQIKKILPENTSNFIAFGLSDINKFHQDLKNYFDKRGELKDLEKQVKQIQSSTGLDLNRDIKPLLDKEFVLVENSYGEKFAVIKVLNGRNLNFKLQLVSTAVNEQISKVNHSNIFYYYFGDPLKKFIKPYFAVADNYLIIANTPGIIRNFISGYEQGRFLANTEGFRQYDQLVANKSNILYFVHNKNSKIVIRSTLRSAYAKAFRSDAFGLEKFYGLSFQWTADKDHFFANLYLSYNSSDSLALNR